MIHGRFIIFFFVFELLVCVHFVQFVRSVHDTQMHRRHKCCLSIHICTWILRNINTTQHTHTQIESFSNITYHQHFNITIIMWKKTYFFFVDYGNSIKRISFFYQCNLIGGESDLHVVLANSLFKCEFEMISSWSEWNYPSHYTNALMKCTMWHCQIMQLPAGSSATS